MSSLTTRTVVAPLAAALRDARPSASASLSVHHTSLAPRWAHASPTAPVPHPSSRMARPSTRRPAQPVANAPMLSRAAGPQRTPALRVRAGVRVSVLTFGQVTYQQWRTRSVATAEAEAVGVLAMAREARRQRADGVEETLLVRDR
eukprot:scaffold2954_cov47-Phaeocystis_antarctica.AAC.3